MKQDIIIRLGKILGVPDGGWGQIYDFLPEDENKRKLRGHLIAVLSSQGFGEGVKSVEIGREIISRLQEEYFGNTQGSAFETLKKAVEKVGSEFSDDRTKICIVALVVWEDILYTSIFGNGKIAILRDDKLAICESPISGRVENGDIFLLSTDTLFEILGRGVLKAILETGDTEKIVEQILSKLYKQSELYQKEEGEIAAAVVKLVYQPSEIGILKPSVYKDSEEKSQAEDFGLGIRRRIQKILFWIAEKLPQGPVYVRRNRNPKKTAFSIAIILLILLIISGILGTRQRKINLYKESYQNRLVSASKLIDQAEKISELDPAKARQLLNQAKDELDDLARQGAGDEKISQEQERLNQVFSSIFKEREVSGEILLDLATIREGLSANFITSFENQVLTFDSSEGKLASFDFDGKKAQILAGKEIAGGARFTTIYAGRVFILKDDGVYEVKNGQAKRVIENKDWDKIVGFRSYAANLYLFEQNGEILRYQGFERGFGAKQKWFGPQTGIDFSTLKDVAIDGSIWVLKTDGQILKFNQGSPDNFSLSASLSFIEPVSLFSSDTLENIYILDKGASKIFVFGKKGEFKQTLTWDKLKDALGIVVSPDEKKILILIENKVYKIDI